MGSLKVAEGRETTPNDDLKGCGAPEHYPVQLLADYEALTETKAKSALRATVVRTRSLAGRRLLAYAAARDLASLEELIQAARNGSEGTIASPETMSPTGLTDLAHAILQQSILPTDAEDAFHLLEYALNLFGAHRLPATAQGIHLQLALTRGDRAHVRQLLRRYRLVSKIIRSTVKLDLENPFLSGDTTNQDKWLKQLESLLPEGTLELSPESSVVPFDRLNAVAHVPRHQDPKVTVIFTCYEPDLGTTTALRSILRQTWRNLEVLLVDDGSPSRYADFLRHAESQDERVNLLKLRTNAGTYRARNEALSVATGTYVTFMDSDDWAHPKRIEEQVVALRSDRTRLATTSDMLHVTDQLSFTQPGRQPRGTYGPSLMFERVPVLERIGYLHGVRKAADTEYQKRMEAAFGSDAVGRDRNRYHALKRRRDDSLSGSEFRGAWAHPARSAYWSAYAEWHREITEGLIDPYVPREEPFPFPAPARFQSDRDSAEEPRTYDVVLACDWRPYGGPQKSMMEEVHALTRAGFRVGILQLEGYRWMSARHRPLFREIQRLINDGTVDHVLMSEAHRVSLLILRYPPILQFPPVDESTLEVERMLILANQPPSELDGSDLRYLPEPCTEAAQRMFGVEPSWVPQGPQARKALKCAGLPDTAMTEFDMPGIIGFEHCDLPRREYRSNIPVVGRHSRDHWSKWPADRETLLSAYPDSDEMDVRFLGGAQVAARILDGEFPGNWLSYGYDEVDVGSFLFQLDFWVYFPHPARSEAFGRAILEALASGCVVILPPQFESTFGDAALYCFPDEVQEIVMSLYTRWDAYSQQSDLGRLRARERFGHETYVKLVRDILSVESRLLQPSMRN